MKWLEEDTPQEKGRKAERKYAKKIGARPTFASGAFIQDKGDIDYENYLIEHKHTTKQTYTLSHKVLQKIINEGRQNKQEGVLIIDFSGDKYIIRKIN